MKSVLLIGLGRFGRSIAEKLNEMHHQIMAVDRDEPRSEIQPMKPSCVPWVWTIMTSALLPSARISRVPWKPRPS